MSPSLRWIAPVAVAGLVAAGLGLPRLADASDDLDGLAPKSPAQLLAAVSRASVEGLSGTVVSTSRSGLPQLPSGGSGGSAVSLPGLLSGSTTARVWKAGDTRARIAVDAPFTEYDVVRDGRDLWTFDSASSDVTHVRLPQEPTVPHRTVPAPQTAADPTAAAQALVDAVDDSTLVSVGRNAVVAGRPAYELVLDPRDPGTLVGTVRIAVDGATSVPLRVQVFAEGAQEPALEVGFTSVRFAVPDASVFSFVPPSGAQVTEKDLTTARRPAQPAPSDLTLPTVLGEGWTSVVRLDGVAVPEEASGLLAQLSTPVPGGRVVRSALVSVLLTDDGRVLAGAVPPAALQAAAK